ncbi:MAG: ATP-binding protein [Nitrospirae bacterium]|nr:ATP-binding protein [Nitrospirota bacterium]
MTYFTRDLTPLLVAAARRFPAAIVTGPRRSGKTTLLRRVFPKADYHLLEDPDLIARVRSDPRGFVDELKPPVILDEVQNAPELLNYVRTRIDLAKGRRGPWLLTGSQEAPLMRGVTESLAGRAAVFNLLPLSARETPKATLFRGGFPEVILHPSRPGIWYRSYLQTYLERDIRSISAIRDLATFRRFLSLLATRSGQVLNKTDLAAPLGLSVPGVSNWLDLLEITMQILIVPPYYENLGKRLIKSPKIYFTDSGLACHLLGIESPQMLERSPFLGPLFEGWIASEIIKYELNSGRNRRLYYFRDQQGLEVDFLVPSEGRKLTLLEVKASRTPRPEMAGPLQRLSRSIKRYETAPILVHRGTPGNRVLAPGVKAYSADDFVRTLPTLLK